LKYLVKRILDADFGCEEWPEGRPRMVLLKLSDEAGQELYREVPEAYIYDQFIFEGDWISFYENNKIVKEQQ
jgi:hypothetical protein